MPAPSGRCPRAVAWRACPRVPRRRGGDVLAGPLRVQTGRCLTMPARPGPADPRAAQADYGRQPAQPGARVIRTLKKPCVHRHRFERQQHAMRVIGDWTQCYNHQRPYRALGMHAPPRPMPWRPDLCRKGWVITRQLVREHAHPERDLHALVRREC